MVVVLLALACGTTTSGADPVGDDCDADADGWTADEPRCTGRDEVADCDDADPAVYPGALEACDGLDNDCSGLPDDGSDADADGSYTCADCDDLNASVYPGAKDACDGIDNDCSGYADEAYDADGDGFSPCGGDCDDADPRRAGGIPEACNGYDDDCDGSVDEGFDADADGWLTCRGDCDDANAGTHWGAAEGCDGIDNDCDTAIDDEPSCFGCVASGSWYLCPAPTSFELAQSACSGMLSGLVEVYDQGTNDALAATTGSVLAGAWWMGLSDDDEEGTWIWGSEAGALYTSWAHGQPDDLDGQDCAAINGVGAGLWADEDCDLALPFVCG